MHIKIVNTDWLMVVLPDKDFESFVDQHSDAEVDTNDKIIRFRNSTLSVPIVRHELFHAYFDSTCVEDADLDSHQTEEVAATLMERYADDLVNNAKLVYTELSKNELS